MSLNSDSDVRNFCKSITKLKNLAPGSLTFTVAVTAKRDVKEQKVIKPNGHWKVSIIEAEFNLLEAKLKANK